MVIGGTVFAGCLFIGLGIGLLIGQPGPGVLIGMGVGLVLMGFGAPMSKMMHKVMDEMDREGTRKE